MNRYFILFFPTASFADYTISSFVTATTGDLVDGKGQRFRMRQGAIAALIGAGIEEFAATHCIQNQAGGTKAFIEVA